MGSLPQIEKLKQTQEALRYQFICVELDLAITFVGISKSTDDPERAERNLDNARVAVQAAKKYLTEAKLTAETRKEILDKLNRLEPALLSPNPSAKSE